MHGRPGTKAELEALVGAATELQFMGLGKQAALLQSLHRKLTEPRAVPSRGLGRKVQAALTGPGGGGVIPVTATDTWWAGIDRRCQALGVTEEDAAVVGRWLANQVWARDFTIDRVLAGWPSYLARARKTEKPSEQNWARREFGDLAREPGDGA